MKHTAADWRKAISRKAAAAVFAGLALLAAGCSGDGSDTHAAGSASLVVATTGIWADVVDNVACEGGIDLRTLLPRGADPHRFEPSLADRGLMDDAVVVFSNGLELEESLLDTLEAVQRAGTPVFRIGDHIPTIPFNFSDGHGEADHDDHDADHDAEGEGHDHDDHGEADHESHDDHDGDDDHGAHDDHEHDEAHDHDAEGEEGHDHDEDHESHDDHEDADHDDHDSDDGHESHDDDADDGHENDDDDDRGDDEAGQEPHDDHEGHDHSGSDPHVWFDPQRVSGVLAELGEQLVGLAGLDSEAVGRCIAAYQEELSALDAEIAELVESVPQSGRLLVTSHDALGYFADRYGFSVIGTVIPAPTTLAESNPAQLEALAQTISEHGVRAIFAETQHSARDTEALAARVGDVEVVTLFTGSLGEAGSGAETYLGFMRTNAALITDALS